jgi:hypothetical protein
VELLLLNNRKTIVNVERIKPYFESSSNEKFAPSSKENFSPETNTVLHETELCDTSETNQLSASLLPRKRGRPPKTSLPEDTPPARSQFQNKGGIVDVNDSALSFNDAAQQQQPQQPSNVNDSALSSKVNQRMTRSQSKLAQSKQVVAYINYVNHLQNDVAQKLAFKVASNKRKKEKQLQKVILNCQCQKEDHEQECQKEWRKVKHLLNVFKREEQFSDHSFESAELDEELLFFDQLPFHFFDDDDDGYGGSSPIPHDHDSEVQVEPPGEIEVSRSGRSSPFATTEQLSPVPKGPTQRIPPTKSATDVLRPTPVLDRANVYEATEDSDEFHSVNETVELLSNTLADLERSTQVQLSQVHTQADYNTILQRFHQEQQRLQRQLRYQQRLLDRLQPTTSTPAPKKKRSPLAQVDRFFFGDPDNPSKPHDGKSGSGKAKK